MPENPPAVLVFDVNETLSDLSPLRGRFQEIGLRADQMPLWFAGILRDGLGLAAAGGYADFAELARDGLRALLAETAAGSTGPDEDAVEHVVSGFAELSVHPDVPEGVRALRAAGFRLVTMTNGSPALTDGLLRRAGVRDCFEALYGVSAPRRWKPHPAAYRYPVEQTGVRPGQAMLVAVHPWDVDGAQRAGLRGAWIRRGAAAAAYPRWATRPGSAARDLVELAALLR